MMDNHITNKDLQEEFYQKVVKERFPEVDRSHSVQMTSAVYKKLAKEMDAGSCPKVRIKYFGLFQVYIKRASYQLKFLMDSLDKGKIEPSIYFKKREHLVNYITNSLDQRAKVLKEKVPEELLNVLLHYKVPEEGRTKFYYKYKKWLK